MKPLPWSPSALETFQNCPRQYHHRYVLMDLPYEEKSKEQLFGDVAHLAFANRQSPRKLALPPDLQAHEWFMQLLDRQPGLAFVEHKAALAKTLEPCDWDHPQVWCRMIVDYLRMDAVSRQAWIVDYKTGKPHDKINQLVIYALWTFSQFAYIDTIGVTFYWTKDYTTSGKLWTRDDIPGLWDGLTPGLRQYRDAFREGVWQPRPSGLCNGWCPVTDCQHWRPKR